MPTIHPQQQAGGSSGNDGAPSQRSTFRPPWIKDGPNPLPMPAAPWTLARARDRRTSRDEPAQPPEVAPVRKQSKITIIPSQPNAANGVTEAKLKQDVISAAANKVDIQTASKQSPPKEKKIDIQVQSKQTPKESAAAPKEKIDIQVQSKQTPKENAAAPKEKKIDIQVQSKQSPKKEEASSQQSAPRERKLDIQVASKQSNKEEPPKERKIEIQKKSSTERPSEIQRKPSTEHPSEIQRKPSMERPIEIQRKTSRDFVPPKPPAPPMPPPPLPGQTQQLSQEQAAKVEALRSRPRKRPDWGAMMKEVESGKKLNHVQCNDRSAPLLPGIKVMETFMYESEKPNVHNRLLQEIQGGVNLKRVQCNDRSKPILDGLRKFRRQLTIEEQMQKSEVAPVEVEPDELDDIDKVRDDLQSTKQMLALELRNKEAVERENKRLQARLLNLEVELEKQRLAKQKSTAPSAEDKKSEEEKMQVKLKEELDMAQKQTEELENKFHESASQLDMARADLEEARRKNAALERKLAAVGKDQPLMRQPSAKKLASMSNINAAANSAMMQPPEDEESEYEYETETEEEEDSSEDEEKAAAMREKRTARELKLLNTKVYSLKEKEDVARKERRALHLQLKNQQRALRDEKKKYKVLQKEVDKMSSLMNDEDEEEEKEEEEESEEEEEESEESSSEESEEEQSDGDLPSEASVEERKKNYMERSKRHENILAALRKGNYLLKANVDKLKDDLFKQKEMALTLQEDLNSVLAELG